tara:strand:- start:2941 stop:3720 length:780 start_codon:yes stop_codon:yes gene_type:complete
MTPVVTANIIGPSPGMAGIGNQLYQIAAVLSYAEDYGHTPIFPCLKRSGYGDYISNFLTKLNVDDYQGPISFYREPSFKYTPIPQVAESLCIDSSYLQSEKYFAHNRDLILSTIKLSKGDESYLREKYKDLDSTTAMHIRRGDYLQYSDRHTNLTDTDYYKKALDYLKPEKVLIFTDDPAWAKDNFSEYTVVEETQDYLEIFLMSYCRDNIIANSTFSWWGAWLNDNPTKKVVAPKDWFGPAIPNDEAIDLIPKGWTIL